MMTKLLLLKHISSLPDTALAREIYTLQKEHSSEGLVKECSEYINTLSLDEPENYSKKGWSKTIKECIHQKNKSDLLTLSRSYRKIDVEKLSSEEYGAKKYLSTMKLSDAWTAFLARAHMLSTFQCNFKNNPEFVTNNFMCICKEHRDDQESVLNCRLYEHLREGLDLENNDLDLVRYYQLVIEERNRETET